MDEIKLEQEVPKPIKEEPNLTQKVESLWLQANNIVKKDPEMKIPRKMKVTKRKLRKGYMGVQLIHENGNTSFEKCQLVDSTFKTRDGVLHTTDGREILMWNGKFPYVVQEAKKINPKNFKFNEGANEVYGQHYIRAKMLQEAIKPKQGGMGIILILLAIGAGIFFLSKIGLFGGGAG